jgi:hypothetical protein
MQHYWGAQAICDRIGYRSPARLPDLIIRYQLPSFKRRHPQKHHILVYYSNESMLSKWELARSQRNREQLIAKQNERTLAKQERQRYGPRGLKKAPSPDPNT